MSKTNQLFSELENLEMQISSLQSEMSNKDARLKMYEQQMSWLTEQLNTLKRGIYGTKSERWETEEQMLLFNEAEMESRNPDHDKDEDDSVEVKGHTKKRGHRKPLPANLPREVIKVELPQNEQVTEDGTALKVIGWEVSEKLKYEPAKISVIEYHRAKYGVDSGDYIKTALPVPSIIPKGIATPELIAAIITGKYADGMPLYRMESMFERNDIDLSRGTMSRWTVQAARALQPIFNILSDRLLESFYVACDETRVQVLKEDGRKAETDSWMWVRSTPGDEKKVILFDYTTSRDSETAKKLFVDYKGYFQADGLASYNCLESEETIRIGCHMHARRKFEQATKDGAKAGQNLAAYFMNEYSKIYDFEEELKSKSSEERRQTRDKLIKPILEKMKLKAEEQKPKVPDKSKIGMAIKYFLSEYSYLVAYLRDGRLNPDNGFTERAIRKFAIGRNNWMFSDTPDGADASAILYSLVVTAKVNGVNVYRALTKILNEIPRAQSCEDYERLADLILTPPPNV